MILSTVTRLEDQTDIPQKRLFWLVEQCFAALGSDFDLVSTLKNFNNLEGSILGQIQILKENPAKNEKNFFEKIQILSFLGPISQFCVDSPPPPPQKTFLEFSDLKGFGLNPPGYCSAARQKLEVINLLKPYFL